MLTFLKKQNNEALIFSVCNNYRTKWSALKLNQKRERIICSEKEFYFHIEADQHHNYKLSGLNFCLSVSEFDHQCLVRFWKHDRSMKN